MKTFYTHTFEETQNCQGQRLSRVVTIITNNPAEHDTSLVQVNEHSSLEEAQAFCEQNTTEWL